MSQNFPCYEKGQLITAPTTNEGAVQLGDGGARVKAAIDLLLFNPGPNLVYVYACSDAAGQADNTCAPLPGGALWFYRKGGHTHLSLLAIGAAQNVTVVLAEGN